MREQMRAYFDELAADRDLRVVFLRGAGGTFISGADIKEFLEQRTTEALLDGARLEEEMSRSIEKIPAPVIAVIEGYCLGGGLTLASACDIRIATTDAKLGIPSAKSLGNALAPGMYARLASIIGQARVRELLILAPTLTADTALTWGLVNETVAPDALEARVTEIADQLSTYAPLTMWAAKEAMVRNVGAHPDTSDVLERVFESSDFHEGVNAFVEKRKPVWRNE
jgi:enoyl-CoA hydratase